MRYRDLLKDSDLALYARAFNARARKKGRTDMLSIEDLRGVILDCGGVCGWCGIALVNQPFEIDHIIALADRGAHHPHNLVVCCPACNRQKASTPPLRFALALVARRGHVTPTIQRVLDHYGAQAHIQPGLFEDE